MALVDGCTSEAEFSSVTLGELQDLRQKIGLKKFDSSLKDFKVREEEAGRKNFRRAIKKGSVCSK